MNRRFLLLLLSVLSFFSFNECQSIPTGHVGLVYSPYSTNSLDPKPKGPGTYWVGFTSSMIVYSTQLESHTENVEVITRDDLRIDVIATIIVNPVKEEVYLLEQQIGRDYYKMVVSQEFRTCIRNVMTGYPMIQISKKTPEIEQEIKAEVIRRIQGKHILVDDVVISDINYSHKIFEAIENKLTKEQQLEAMKFQLRITQKDNEMERMKAKREAEIAVINAEAEAKATLVKAKAQSQAQELINQKLTNRYIQYRALQNPNNKIIYYPIGKDGLPVLVNPDFGGKGK